MKKIDFASQVLPHVVAVGVFLLVTIFFFNPIFFENKSLQQYDIQQHLGASRTIEDFREQTGEEALWAETPDGREAPAEASLELLAALHRRWTILLESLAEADFSRAFSHPDRGLMTIDKAIQLYAWHGLHHTAHVRAVRARQGW